MWFVRQFSSPGTVSSLRTYSSCGAPKLYSLMATPTTIGDSSSSHALEGTGALRGARNIGFWCSWGDIGHSESQVPPRKAIAIVSWLGDRHPYASARSHIVFNACTRRGRPAPNENCLFRIRCASSIVNRRANWTPAGAATYCLGIHNAQNP